MINNLILWQGVSYSCSVERLTGSRWQILSRIRRPPTAEGPSLSAWRPQLLWFGIQPEEIVILWADRRGSRPRPGHISKTRTEARSRRPLVNGNGRTIV